MSIKESELLELAEELAEGDSEVYWRASAGRAYYSLFHTCKKIGEKLPEVLGESRGSHMDVIEKFKEYWPSEACSIDKMTVRSIGINLLQLRNIRSEADYKLSLDFTKDKAEEASERAQKILEKINTANL